MSENSKKVCDSSPKKQTESSPRRISHITDIPSVNDFALDFYHDTGTFNLDVNELKRQQIEKMLLQQVDETKYKVYREHVEPFKPKIIRKYFAHEKMLEHAKDLPLASMYPAMKTCIMRRVGHFRFVRNFFHLTPEIMGEIEREFYAATIHDITVDSKVKPLDDRVTHIKLECYKYRGRSRRYRQFVLTREDLKERLFITFPIMRKLLAHIVTGLPDIAIDFSGVHIPNGFNVADVKSLLRKRMLRMTLYLEGEWYKKIYKFIVEDTTPVAEELLPNYLGAATGLICLYISQMIRNTVEEFVEVVGDEKRTPVLKIQLYHDFGLHLLPEPEHIEHVYCTLINDIQKIAIYLRTIEYLCTKNSAKKYIKLDIPEDFKTNMLRKVKENVQKIFQPIRNYMVWICDAYAPLYDLTTQARQINEMDLSFDEGCDLIEYYHSYVVKLRNMRPLKRFQVCVLEQSNVIAHLRRSAELIITALTSRMMNLLKIENRDICEMFKFLKMRAETVPRSTAELVELMKYMIWASVDHLNELKERVQNAIQMMLRLLNITNVSKDCMKRMATTIQWVFDITDILDKNASMLERMKSEFEETLQRTIEKLNNGIVEMIPFLVTLDDMDDSDRAGEYLHKLRGMIKKIRTFDAWNIWINKEEVLFKFPCSSYPELQELKNYIYPFFKVVYMCHKWNRYYKVWMDGPFELLEFEKAEFIVDELYKELQKTQKAYRAKIKQAIADNNPRRFSGLVDDPDPLNLPAPLKLCSKTMQYIKDFRPNMTVINIFCASALCQRHWDEMSEIAGFDMTPNAGTTLRKLIDRGFGPFLDQYEIISTGAVKERQLWVNLQKMIAEWEDIRFKTNVYKDTGISILSGLDDIQVVLDDHIIKTLTMRGSVFVKYFEADVKAWYEKIVRMNSTIDEWGKVQSQWLYLLPIFSSKDIIAQMPEEGVLFKQVDTTYRRYMLAVQKDSKVTSTAGAIGMLEAMVECSGLLDRINDGVANYLEKKRLYFPRFFFLSNDEMLEILSETKDPLRVQPHLRKCFEGINRLEFDRLLQISAMFSGEGEQLNFIEIIKTEEARGSVEKWLVQVETQMLASVLNEISRSFVNYSEIARTKWVQQWPGQVVLCVSQIYWTAQVHCCLCAKPTSTLKEFHSELTVQLQAIVTLVRSPVITNLARITIKALIVIDVHAKDVIKELIEKHVKMDTEFKWLSQLRYYWEEELCMVRMINATVPYANEYLGNSDRLVITPLTDRCYRTLIGAYHLHLNGAPEGPAGTGKTETTKDLAKALAVQCVVFNCSDGLDYKAMGKFFKGLASCGAWACFDEFNRIELEVLSVVAQQILSIVLSVRANLSKFVFEGTELNLNHSVYICITMNPGYAGRSELPDNLKVLFRTVAMMVPDYAMIGEISLYSYGFIDARTLSVKIVTTYRLCSEQLSSQNHYDYGMRAVKTVLSACGNNKRKFPDENEDILLLRSLVDVNLPKFLSFDVPLFEGIISDLFPGISLPEPDYSELIDACQASCNERNLQLRDVFMLKLIQTYEMMIVRHGFMLVGDPLCGKTSTLKVLGDALTIMSEQGLNQVPVHYQFINPKSITMGQLYGQFDPISYEWTDGVVATCFRRFAMDPTPDRNWIIFDGPVDAVWIENMNTVLDDNKKLCLTSGEVMCMSNSMSMIFEVMDLAQASPATVSRCGMIYMESANLGWRPFYESWVNSVNPFWRDNHERVLATLFDWLIPACLNFMRKNCRQLVYPGEINIARSTMNIVEITLDDACKEYEGDSQHMVAWIQATVMMAIVWGLAGILDADSRLKFDEFYKDLWKGFNEDYPIPEMEKIEIPIPNEGILMDYLYIYKTQKGSWKYWPDLVKLERINESGSVQQILIPTLETIRYIHMIDMHVKHRLPVLLVGPTGTGKSFYMQDLLMNRLSQDTFEPAFITFTAQTQANQTQELIISKLMKGKRGHYGAPKGKTSIIFIDDMNMPAKEVYGAQPPIELLRQFFDHGHWYNLKDTTKIFLHDMLLVAAMGLVGGSRQDIYPRFLRHFTVFSINDFSDDTMVKIFSFVLLAALKRNGFATDVMMNVQCIVNATLAIYKAASKELLPTPAKSHYIFNLRDISRIVFGCGLLKKDTAENKKVFARLWVHESLRIFYDRLIDDSDRRWVYNKLRDCVKEYFKDNFDNIFDNLRNEDGTVTETALHDLLFASFLDPDATEDEKKYEEIESITMLEELALNCLEEYNSTHKSKMDIVLFRYALEHMNKICRILSMPRGSALLVGTGGSGRQSLTRLAAALCGQNIFQPEITKNYGLSEFRDDIKVILKESGGLGKHTVFLFTEDQLKEDSFLQDIDSLLNSGEVPNLYAIDEKQEILELVRLAAQGGNRNLDISPLVVFSFFINRCKEKLHIILSFSPIGSSFRSRLRLFPSLVNCCTIDWYEGWPENALEMVAHHWMKDLNVTTAVKNAAVETCKTFHVQARDISDVFYKQYGRKTYITSASYLDLIVSYQTLTNKKQIEVMNARNRYLSGLDKLDFAAEQVGVMQISLEELQPQLKEMTAKATAMLKDIEQETIRAEHASMLVREDEKVANVQAAAAQSLKAECEADLALAIPILEEAIDALNTLKPADITLVKSMKNPPAAVKLVMAAVCVMKDVKPDRVPEPGTGKMVLDFWGPSKRILGEMSFLQQLKDFDKDHIPIAIMTKIRKEFLPHKDFKPEIVVKASSAAEGLCKWIIAMDLYDAVAREVAPKKEKLEKAESEYQATMAVLQEKRDQVARLEQRLADLNDQLLEAQAEQQKLQDAVTLCSDKLIRAEKLIGGLGGEKNRWMKAAEDLLKLYECLPGDILISCGVIAYLAPFTMQVRASAINDWQALCKKYEIPCSNHFDFITVLGSEILIQEWYISGLPRDSFSTQNAIIQNTSKRWSLLVDPQLQANKWIKTLEKSNNLGVVKFSDGNYMKIIEHCLEFGMPVLVENIWETLEAPLDPLLGKKTFKQGGVEVISLGDSVIPYHPRFRLYLTSKLRNPHYLPEVFNKVTIVNFALTAEGLEDQLLGIVVANERPDLQRQKEQLVVESAENKAALKDVEDSILKTLSETEGNILENETAIKVLDYAKTLAAEIIQKQAVTKKTEASIEKFRQAYRPVAAYSTVLYYSISDLPNVDPMYQYSLNWFINLYRSSVLNSTKSNVIQERLDCIIEVFTYNLYTNVCRSLFEKDKLLYSFVLCTKIMMFQKQLDHSQYIFFLTGGIAVENPVLNPASEWFGNNTWDELCRLSDIPSFTGLVDHFKNNLDKWHKFYDLAQPQEHSLPDPWQKKLSPFERLMMMRVVRPDKVVISIHLFVEDTLGTPYVSPPPFDLFKSYADSNNLCPLVFILSAGADPIMALNKFAERKGMISRFNSISLGQGQGPIAELMIQEAMVEGNWVCLQNCHLAVSWMSRLEKLCEMLDDRNTHDAFRIWLTSYPSDKFPVSILQNGVKITNEPPGGLKENLRLSFLTDPIKDPDFFYSLHGKEKTFSRLLYGICFFHAVIQERRTFGPLGWNIPYGFNDSDLHISIQQLQMFLGEYDEIPYEAISYLTGECNYGGRVTDDWDRRLIITILADFINPHVVNVKEYQFSEVDRCYGLPEKISYDDFLEFIDKLPTLHPPEVFGLHKNAGITRDLQNTNLMLSSLLLVEGEATAAGGSTDELLLMLITEILSKLPPNFDMEDAKRKFPVDYSESMNTVLVQELERFNKLLSEIRNSLRNLKQAVHGMVVMTPQLEMVANAMLLSRIPASWAKVSYPSLKNLSNYILDFIERIDFLRKWYDEGKPCTFWLSGFFFTQAFLTGAKQNYARKYTIPIDRLDFDFEILQEDSYTTVPDEGIYMNGLFVDGARWDRELGYLAEQRPKILWDTLPAVWAKPILVAEFSDRGRYKSPVYKTSERRGTLSTTGHSTNYVLPIFLDTNVPPAHWVKRSVALLCQLD